MVIDDEISFILGVPVPSDNIFFLAIIVVHIVFGLICIISGTVAMLSQQTKKKHARAGKTYYWGRAVLFIIIIITSLLRWPFNTHLLIVGTAAYALTLVGQRVAKCQ